MSDQTLMETLSTVDVCVDPDPSNPFNGRSSMIKLSEYMALGKPAVAYDLPEHRVTASDAAVYAHPNNPLALARCIDELFDDPSARVRMGEFGQSRVVEFLSWSHQEEALLAVYRSVLTCKRDRRFSR